MNKRAQSAKRRRLLRETLGPTALCLEHAAIRRVNGIPPDKEPTMTQQTSTPEIERFLTLVREDRGDQFAEACRRIIDKQTAEDIPFSVFAVMSAARQELMADDLLEFELMNHQPFSLNCCDTDFEIELIDDEPSETDSDL